MFVELLDRGCMPIKKHVGDAGYDCFLSLDEPLTLRAHETKTVPLGFKIMIGSGYGGIIKCRSNIFKKGINIDGLVDSGYRGEVHVMIQNTTNETFIFEPYDRICQIIIAKLDTTKLIQVQEIPNDTTRGAGKFGSTGGKI